MPQEYPIILRGFLGTVRTIEDVDWTAGLRADIYLPVEAQRPLPTILFLNDGEPGSDHKTGPDLERYFGQRSLAMVSVEYRSADDIPAAVEWVRNRAEEYGLDAARIGVWGVGKGASLALEANPPGVKAIAAGYPFPDPKAAAGLPPVMLIHGLDDDRIPPSQTELLFDRLGMAGTNVTMCLIEELGAGFLNRSDFDQNEFRRLRKYECRDGEPPVITEAPPFTFGTIETFFRRWL